MLFSFWLAWFGLMTGRGGRACEARRREGGWMVKLTGSEGVWRVKTRRCSLSSGWFAPGAGQVEQRANAVRLER